MIVRPDCSKSEPARILQSLFDDLNDPMGAWVDQNSPVVDDGVTISRDAIFGRNFVILDAVRRENRAGSHGFPISVGWAVLMDDVIAKARTLVDAEQAVDAARDPAD